MFQWSFNALNIIVDSNKSIDELIVGNSVQQVVQLNLTKAQTTVQTLLRRH